MPDRSRIFADRLVTVAITGSLVRIEPGAMQGPTAEGQKPQLLPSQTLVMAPDGFVASFGMMEPVIKRVMADGVGNAPASVTR